jgi:hypothetical protein
MRCSTELCDQISRDCCQEVRFIARFVINLELVYNFEEIIALNPTLN